jgi:hypothetical protein
MAADEQTEAPLQSKKPVTSLSHYTSLSGLIGILDHHELWASNVAFLNDREEHLLHIRCRCGKGPRYNRRCVGQERDPSVHSLNRPLPSR